MATFTIIRFHNVTLFIIYLAVLPRLYLLASPYEIYHLDSVPQKLPVQLAWLRIFLSPVDYWHSGKLLSFECYCGAKYKMWYKLIGCWFFRTIWLAEMFISLQSNGTNSCQMNTIGINKIDKFYTLYSVTVVFVQLSIYSETRCF